MKNTLDNKDYRYQVVDPWILCGSTLYTVEMEPSDLQLYGSDQP